MNALEAKAAKQDGKLKREKNLISQLTLLAGIIAGAWVIVTVLNLIPVNDGGAYEDVSGNGAGIQTPSA